MGNIITLIVQGAFLGSMYGLAAIGLSLIFGTMRIVFISQGAVIVLFAYFSFWMNSLFGVDPYLSIIPNVVIAFLVGALIYYCLFKQTAVLQDRIASLLIAVGIMFFLENFMTIVWSPDSRAIITDYAYIRLNVFGFNLTLVRLLGLFIAIIATFAVFFFLKRTLIGMCVRAVSEDLEASTLMGINPDLINVVAFGIGIALAAVAGINLATTYSFDPMSGFTYSIKALIALTLGGVGTVAGAILGGIILGLIELFSGYYLGTGWAQAIVFFVFLVVLIVRPQGILGKIVEKA